MNKILLLSLFFMVSIACAVEIPIDKAKERKFGKSIQINSKIIQLSSSKQSVMALVGGQIKEYYVKSGQKVQEGQKIALIKSIKLSKMTSEFISLQKQYNSLNQNFKASQDLHSKGVVSLQELNLANIKRNEMLSKLETLNSQLQTLGIDTYNLKNTSANYILYSHSSGTVTALLQPQHSVISEDTEILSIIKEQSFYVKSYLPLSYSKYLKVGQKISIKHNNKNIVTKIDQILPEVDEKTQRIVVLSSINEKIDGLFINSYISSILYFNTDKTYIAVKKSALSFFNNEWVVFLPTSEKHDDEEGQKSDHEEENHEKEDHKEETKHEESNHKEDEHKEEKHEKVDHDEEEEQQYVARDVKIIEQDDEYVAIEGLRINEEYVSDKSYFVKSMVLKSSLGGHGH